jgi:galactokinase
MAMREDSTGAARTGAGTPRLSADAADAATEVRARFRARFSAESRVFRAPGRVNLIGEHTDYNDGLVMPLAIEAATLVAAAPRTDRALYAVSASEPAEVCIDLDQPGAPRTGSWADYLQGVVRALRSRGRRLAGADLYVCSTIPRGAGLSSSAALEVAVAHALLAISGESMGALELAAACQAAEHEWVGTRCGIMDHLAVLCGEVGHAMAIDCRTLRLQMVPLPLDEVALLVTDSSVVHQLAASAYNQRRGECEAAVEALRAVAPGVRSLRDVSPSDLARWGYLLPEPLAARARHVVSEITRVEEAVAALRARDWSRLGQLLYASHASLRDEFRVSTVELDLLVETAASVRGVFGARMTGGGFGGCVITLAPREVLSSLRERMERAMLDGFGRHAPCFETRAEAGAAELVARPPGAQA